MNGSKSKAKNKQNVKWDQEISVCEISAKIQRKLYYVCAIFGAFGGVSERQPGRRMVRVICERVHVHVCVSECAR